MQPMTPDITRRLALIRLLLARAEQESHLSPPYSTDSINRLHDVAEMFLALAAQAHHCQIPKEFDKYWDILETSLGRPLSYRAQMQKFNKIRVNLKHYGTEPAAQEIESSRSAVRGLLYDETPDLFGINLDEVSLSNFVACADARRFLDSAEAKWVTGESGEAFADIAESFEDLIADYKRRKLVWYNQSVFDTIKDLRGISLYGTGFGSKEKRFSDAVIESLSALDDAIALVGLGVDMRRYGKFKVLTPRIFRFVDGRRTIDDPSGISRTQSDFEFCRDFVITTAIHLAEFDYDFDLWETYQTAQKNSREAEQAANSLQRTNAYGLVPAPTMHEPIRSQAADWRSIQAYTSRSFHRRCFPIL